ncbi:WD40-repeat-containing domain protein [Syncephalis plumigaleata]|nr:WD40-repeat-containing domain protein [Syncephalis plumigaleata]
MERRPTRRRRRTALHVQQAKEWKKQTTPRAKLIFAKSKLNYGTTSKAMLKLVSPMENACIMLEELKRRGDDVTAEQSELNEVLSLCADMRYANNVVSRLYKVMSAEEVNGRRKRQRTTPPSPSPPIPAEAIEEERMGTPPLPQLPPTTEATTATQTAVEEEATLSPITTTTTTVHVPTTSPNEIADMYEFYNDYDDNDNNLFSTNHYDNYDLHNEADQHNQPEVDRAATSTDQITNSPQRSTGGVDIREHGPYCPNPTSSGPSISARITLPHIHRPAGIHIRPQLAIPLATVQPIRVLGAHGLADDLSLNLLDWSGKDQLGVGLGRSVYIWDESAMNTTCLDEVDQDDSITCVKWKPQGNHLSVATNRGIIKVWDVERRMTICEYAQHSGRACAMAWCGRILASGGEDGSIAQHDTRTRNAKEVQLLREHSGEICGLQWDPSNMQLASAANDNQVCIWDKRRASLPIFQTQYSNAATKAIAWHPHKSKLLATGSGGQNGRIQ